MIDPMHPPHRKRKATFHVIVAISLMTPFLWGGALDWMKALPDETPITRITIPGTHNSAALREPFRGTAKCQTLTLAEQFEAGVRFVDLRCRHEKDAFQIYHGPIDQGISFAECLATMTRFLQSHPAETIIVSINEASQPNKVTRTFFATFQSYLKPKDWWLDEALPTLGQVRGKMILLRRFKTDQMLGIPATDWRSRVLYSSKKLVIQDLYAPSEVAEKWQAIERAFTLGESQKLHLNFTSGFLKNRLGIPNISAISDPINKRLAAYLPEAPQLSHGVIVLDFITPKLAGAIIKLNFPPKNIERE
jgi:1-phosphatidylinositol phosphodiesterase